MSFPEYMQIALAVDQMYFEAANDSVGRARKLKKVIEKREGVLEYLHFGEIYDLGEEYDPGEEWEKVEEAERHLADAFGRFAQAVALTTIQCALTLEAHINIVAKDKLSRAQFSCFDSMSLESKWLFLPGILGGKPFEAGHEPYQSFTQIIKRRNRLVHPKGIHLLRLVSTDASEREFLDSGLDDAIRDIDTTKAIISGLAIELGQARPAWLDDNSSGFYEFHITSSGQAK
jgi:hypothetical protein